MKQTLIFGNIITMDEKRSFAKAALVKDGVFIFIGDREEAKKGSIERVDLDKMSSWQRDNYDKSGYRKIPAADRYAKKLRSLKIKKVPQLVIDARARLVDLQKSTRQSGMRNICPWAKCAESRKKVW